MKFSEKFKDRVFHVEVANFSSSEDPDTHFIVKIIIFSGIEWHLAVLGCLLYMSLLMVYNSDVQF